MGTYRVDSDKKFVRCLDMHTMEVYELDNLEVAPVKGEHWKHVASIGKGREYNALNIVGAQVGGASLEKLMKDLYASHLIVNREGLCFLATSEVTAMMFGVEYYRLFDLFDWPKYVGEGVHPSLHTKWARSDIVEGRPSLQGGGADHHDRPQVDHKFKISKVTYPGDKFKIVSDFESYGGTKWPVTPETRYYSCVYLPITEKIESSIPEVSIIEDLEFDRNDWLALTIGDYDNSLYNGLILIYYDGRHRTEVLPGGHGLFHIPADPMNGSMNLFPEGFSVFRIYLRTIVDVPMPRIAYVWGIVYDTKNSTFVKT